MPSTESILWVAVVVMAAILVGRTALRLLSRLLSRRDEGDISSGLLQNILNQLQSIETCLQADRPEIVNNGTAIDLSPLVGAVSKSQESAEKASVQQREILERMDGRLAEYLTSQRRVLQAMYGSNGNQDDEVIERARAIQEQYPGLSIEDAIKRARHLQTYSG